MAMDPLVGYGLLSGVSSLASSIFSNVFGQAQSKELMKYQNELQQQSIDKMNEYNTPANQMKRLAAAGLNPNLVYGHGADGNQSSAASAGIANRSVDLGNPIGEGVNAYYQAKQYAANIAMTEQSRRESLQRTAKDAAATLGIMYDNRFKDSTLDTRIKQQSANLDATLKSIEKTNADIDKTTQETNNLKIAANNLIEQGNNLAARTKLTKEQALTEVVKRESLRAGIRLNDAQCRRIAAEIPYINAGTSLRELQYDIQETDFLSDDELNKWLAEHPNVEMADQIIDHIIDKIARVMGAARRTKKSRKSRRK